MSQHFKCVVLVWGAGGGEEGGRMWGMEAKLQALSLAGKRPQTDMKYDKIGHLQV